MLIALAQGYHIFFDQKEESSEKRCPNDKTRGRCRTTIVTEDLFFFFLEKPIVFALILPSKMVISKNKNKRMVFCQSGWIRVDGT